MKYDNLVKYIFDAKSQFVTIMRRVCVSIAHNIQNDIIHVKFI